MSNTAVVTGGKPIAVYLQSISGVSAINSLVAFYDCTVNRLSDCSKQFVDNLKDHLE
jgi:hypothetical protein